MKQLEFNFKSELEQEYLWRYGVSGGVPYRWYRCRLVERKTSQVRIELLEPISNQPFFHKIGSRFWTKKHRLQILQPGD